MIFTIQRDPLFLALQQVQSTVAKRNSMPILTNILCEVKNGNLSLSATDMEVGMRLTFPVEAKQEGRVTLAANHFLDIIKELPSQLVSFTKKDNNWVELVSGRSRFNIVSMAADEYPELPKFEEQKYNEARIDSLKEMIDRTLFSVSTDATRYLLNGVYFENLENGVMRMTGTDGSRLSYVDKEVFLTPVEIKRGIVIPKKGLIELRKILESAGTSIGIAIEKGHLFAKNQDTYLFVRLMEGEYPNYRQIISKTVDCVMKLSTKGFTAALKRVSLLAHEKSRGVKFAIQAGALTISSSNPDMGEAVEEMDIDYSGEPVEIGFNAKYLLDCLSVTESEQLEFFFKDRMSPGIMRGSDHQNHTYVIMPMRL